jgi:PAS domain S-box-containing protein
VLEHIIKARYSEYIPLLLASVLGTSAFAAAMLAPDPYHLSALLLAGILLVSSYSYSRSYQQLRRDTLDTPTIKRELELKSMAIESSMDGMAILNKKDEFIYVNQAHAQVYGYSRPSELIGKPWRMLYDQENLKKFSDEIIPELRRHGKIRVEAEGLRKDGSLFPQEVSLTTLEDGGLICVVRDITERKITEHKAEGMALFAALSPYPVFRFDSRGNVILANPRAIDALGIRPGSQPYLGDLIPGLKKIDFSACISRGSCISSHGKIGGRYYHFTLRGVPREGFGHLYCIDVTLLRLARKRLIESKRFLRKVLDSVPNQIFVKDPQGRFSWVNQGFAELLGSTPRKLIGKFCSASNAKMSISAKHTANCAFLSD